MRKTSRRNAPTNFDPQEPERQPLLPKPNTTITIEKEPQQQPPHPIKTPSTSTSTTSLPEKQRDFPLSSPSTMHHPDIYAAEAFSRHHFSMTPRTSMPNTTRHMSLLPGLSTTSPPAFVNTHLERRISSSDQAISAARKEVCAGGSSFSEGSLRTSLESRGTGAGSGGSVSSRGGGGGSRNSRNHLQRGVGDEKEEQEGEEGEEEEEEDDIDDEQYLRFLQKQQHPHLDIQAIAEYLSQSSTISPFKSSENVFPSKTPSTTQHPHPHPPPPHRITFYSRKTQTLTSPTLETLPFPKPAGTTTTTLPPDTTLLSPGSTFWIDICAPTLQELETVSRLFKIHPLTSEDIQTGEVREKCEAFPNYYFVVIRSVEEEAAKGGCGGAGDVLVPINVYILVFRECVLTFHTKPMVHLDNVLKRIDRLTQYGLSVSPDWLNYALIDDVADCFLPLLEYIEHEVDSIDALVLILKEKEQSDMLLRIGQARRTVTNLLRLLNTKADVIKAIIKRSAQRVAPDSETGLYLQDIQDHVVTMVQNLHHCEKTVSRAHSNYLAQISIEITIASHRQGDVGMKMTAIASILVPLNIVTGLWGMNVKVPGQDDDTIYWFYGIVLGMCVLGYLCFTFFRRYELV